MPENPDAIDRTVPTRRPAGRPTGYQRWHDLLFVHWRVPAERLRPLIPSRLTIDTCEGDAWVGLVAFRMSGIRPWWFPPVPVLSSFCETNVRTYVHCEGRDSGVWFFSLDASSSPAVRIARRRWHLRYYRASMRVERRGNHVRYESRRLWPGAPGAGGTLEAEIERSDASSSTGAEPGTLEHFLAKRYILYTQTADGRLLQGRVHHSPYPLHAVRLIGSDDSLVRAAGIAVPGAPDHVMFSDGVDVEVFPLREI